MIRILSAAALGALFGLGLLISGMLDPAKVLGFLDVTGKWNPQLAFVMGGAVAAAFPAFLVARRRGHAWLGDPMRLPERLHLDVRLVAGAAMFGVGWGLVGVCPGPGVVLLGFAGPAAWLFAAAMAAGLLIARFAAPLLGRRGLADAQAEPVPR